MLRLLTLATAIAVCYCQTSAPLNTICRYVNKAKCSMFAPHPECASNGATFGNRCLFAQAHCKDTSLQVVHTGPCTSTSGTTGSGSGAVVSFFCQQMTSGHCGTDVEQLCGSDGKDYNNFCLFERARCTDQSLYIAKYSKC